MVIIFPFASKAENHDKRHEIIWLDKEPKIFNKGFADMQERLEDEMKKTRSIFWRVLKVFVVEKEIVYDEEKHKVFVNIKARADKKTNNRRACNALISKAKKVLFGENHMEGLKKFFPGVEEKDLAYLMAFKTSIETLGVEDGKTGNLLVIDADEDEEDIPENAIVSKTINCRSELFSNGTYSN